jgi:2-desacetyl-2-hydroxyethyl bacteriochlorophyllide A dehydrogenase
MKTLVCEKPGKLIYKEAAFPEIKDGHSIIRIKKIGICGTDIHAFEGTQPFFNYPRVLGHEVAAQFVEGDAAGFNKGDACSFIPYLSCKKCFACRNGKPNCCSEIKVCGVHINGAMAEYYSVPSSVLLQSAGLNYDELALVEPLSIALHGINRAAVKQNEFVLITGAGPIGMGLIVFAKIYGATVIVMDTRQDRLDFSKQELNADYIVNVDSGDVTEKIKTITGNDMCPVIIDATGNLKAINNAINYLAHGGRYVLVGLQMESFSFSHPEFHKREASLMSSRNAIRSEFEKVIDYIKDKKIDPSVFITHRMAFDDAKDKFGELCDPASKVVKAIIEI